jgi:hypothetical protein
VVMAVEKRSGVFSIHDASGGVLGERIASLVEERGKDGASMYKLAEAEDGECFRGRVERGERGLE